MFYTYILRSQKNGKYYIGHTADLTERLYRHNNGIVKDTRGKGPWEYVYYETYLSKSEANNRELYIKSMKSESLLKSSF
ncbi:MAG: GIY-YIG nuclease family protein [Mucilaginibacter sp.]